MSSLNKFNVFVLDLSQKVHNLGSDQLKVALTNSAPVATNTVIANITEISYTFASTRNITTTSSTQTSGTYKLVLTSLVITASGGAVGPFRYVVIYNSTPGSGNLIGWYDYGSAVTLQDSDTFTVSFDASNGFEQTT